MSEWEFDWDWVPENLNKFIVPDIIRRGREETCRKCEKLNKIKVCKVCGCFMPAKTLLKNEECPLGKWGPIE